jgi:hypothetical protein
VTSLQAEKRVKCRARKCLRASLSRLLKRYRSLLVAGNVRFESLQGHLSVVTLKGHDYPRTLHLHARIALQISQNVRPLHLVTDQGTYPSVYSFILRQRRDQSHRSTRLPEQTQEHFVRRSTTEPETWYAVSPLQQNMPSAWPAGTAKYKKPFRTAYINGGAASASKQEKYSMFNLRRYIVSVPIITTDLCQQTFKISAAILQTNKCINTPTVFLFSTVAPCILIQSQFYCPNLCTIYTL